MGWWKVRGNAACLYILNHLPSQQRWRSRMLRPCWSVSRTFFHKVCCKEWSECAKAVSSKHFCKILSKQRSFFWILCRKNLIPCRGNEKAFNVLYVPRMHVCVCGCMYACACVCCMTFFSARVPSVLKRDLRISNTRSQLYWWLARYGRPASAWVLTTLKTTQVEQYPQWVMLIFHTTLQKPL